LSERLYRTGLIVLGVLCLALTPLTAMGTVSPVFGAAALAVLVAWIVFRVATKARESQHDAPPR
jgi:ABC-type phosphate transport system permease subunit